MKSDILILSDALLEPPSESYAIRDVFMKCHDDLNMHVIVHTSQEMKDLYYKWLKTLGLMDYVEDILNELEWQDGIRLDIVNHYPDTIITKFIRLENELPLIYQIQYFS